MHRSLPAAVVALSMLLAGCTTTLPFLPQGDHTGPGQRAGDYLRRSPYASILVEVDYLQGAEPEARALNLLDQRMEASTGKPVEVRRTPSGAGLGASHKYTTGELARLEEQHRGRFSEGTQAVLYVLYVEGGFEADGSETKTLAVAYRGSAIAVFKGNVREASKQGSLDLTRPPLVEVEESVLVHELGHILGLVNLGTPMVTNHEDPDHKGHSDNEGSVMFWAVEVSLIGSVLGQNPPDDFDANDKADLQAARR